MAKRGTIPLTGGSPPIDDFKARQKQLRAVYSHATANRAARRPRERPLNALKDALYAYFQELKSSGHQQALEDYITDRDKYAWERHKGGDVVWVVRLFETSRCDTLSGTTRSSLYAELALADLNDVRPEMLLAFLYEAGSIDMIKADLRQRVVHTWAARYR